MPALLALALAMAAATSVAATSGTHDQVACTMANCNRCEKDCGKIICVSCKAGYVRAADKRSCSACVAGTFCGGGTASSCSPCGAGWTTTGPAAAACNACRAGFGGNTGRAKKLRRALADSATPSCTACAPGTYARGGSMAGCVSCNCVAPTTCKQFASCSATTGACTFANRANSASCKTAANVPGACRNGACCKTCASSFAADTCGTALDDGCGGTLTCGCRAGSKCSTSVAGRLGNCVAEAPANIDACRFFPCGPGANCTDLRDGVEVAANKANTTAGRRCGCPANSNYANDTAGCVDFDACAAFPCGADAICTDVIGGPTDATGRTCGCAASDPVGCQLTTFEEVNINPGFIFDYWYHGLFWSDFTAYDARRFDCLAQLGTSSCGLNNASSWPTVIASRNKVGAIWTDRHPRQTITLLELRAISATSDTNVLTLEALDLYYHKVATFTATLSTKAVTVLRPNFTHVARVRFILSDGDAVFDNVKVLQHVDADACRLFPCTQTGGGGTALCEDLSDVHEVAEADAETAQGRLCMCDTPSSAYANDTAGCVEVNACDNYPCTGTGVTCADVVGGATNATGRICSCDDATRAYANDTAGCVDINACDAHPCGPGATCSDLIGGPANATGRTCVCDQAGFIDYGDVLGCVDPAIDVITFEEVEILAGDSEAQIMTWYHSLWFPSECLAFNQLKSTCGGALPCGFATELAATRSSQAAYCTDYGSIGARQGVETYSLLELTVSSLSAGDNTFTLTAVDHKGQIVGEFTATVNASSAVVLRPNLTRASFVYITTDTGSGSIAIDNLKVQHFEEINPCPAFPCTQGGAGGNADCMDLADVHDVPLSAAGTLQGRTCVCNAAANTYVNDTVGCVAPPPTVLTETLTFEEVLFDTGASTSNMPPNYHLLAFTDFYAFNSLMSTCSGHPPCGYATLLAATSSSKAIFTSPGATSTIAAAVNGLTFSVTQFTAASALSDGNVLTLTCYGGDNSVIATYTATLNIAPADVVQPAGFSHCARVEATTSAAFALIDDLVVGLGG